MDLDALLMSSIYAPAAESVIIYLIMLIFSWTGSGGVNGTQIFMILYESTFQSAPSVGQAATFEVGEHVTSRLAVFGHS
jgi:hypothetical protein